MPRIARELQIIPGFLVHLISRFVDGRFLFDDAARTEYLCRLGRALEKTDWRLLAFALMSSHIHLCLVSGWMPLEPWLHRVHVGIALWLNKRRRAIAPKTLGHAFADRPKTKLYPLQIAPKVIAYQHRNPDSAGVAEEATESPWTSHAAYVDPSRRPSWLDATLGLGLCGYRDDEAGRMAFDDYVWHRSSAPRDLDELARLACQPSGLVPAPTIELLEPPDPELIVTLAAEVCRVRSESLRSPDRRRAVVAARRVAVRAWCALGGRQAVIASSLGLAKSTVAALACEDDTLDACAEEVIRRVRLRRAA